MINVLTLLWKTGKKPGTSKWEIGSSNSEVRIKLEVRTSISEGEFWKQKPKKSNILNNL
ncbi:MAG: hypothetical protein K0S44_1571 [Bacteroidetes bacterium]|nr:hypothetical protein [Bacteroidota bacterium]